MGGGPPPETKPLSFFVQQAHEVGLADYKGQLAEYEADTQRSLEMLRVGSATGATAIKAVTLINGGAAVAVLAFIGHLVSIRATSATVMNFAWPLALFVGGVFASVISSCVPYLVYCCYFIAQRHEFAGKEARRDNNNDEAIPREEAARKWNRRGTRVNLVAVVLVIASLVLFAFGCSGAYHALKSGVTLEKVEDHPPSLSGLF